MITRSRRGLQKGTNPEGYLWVLWVFWVLGVLLSLCEFFRNI